MALVEGISKCGGIGGEGVHREAILEADLRPSQNGPGNHHRKCPFLWKHRPVGFWAVSGGSPEGPTGSIYVARPANERFVLEPMPFEALHRDRLIEALADGAPPG